MFEMTTKEFNEPKKKKWLKTQHGSYFNYDKIDKFYICYMKDLVYRIYAVNYFSNDSDDSLEYSISDHNTKEEAQEALDKLIQEIS